MTNLTHSTSGLAGAREREDTTYLGALLKRTSWGAIFSGALVAISLQMIFTVLGIAIGVSSADALGTGSDGQASDTISIAAAAWWLVTGTIALFVGGLVVGRFTGLVRSPDVLLHAITMWAVTAIFGFAVVWSGAGMLIGSAIQPSYMRANSGQTGSSSMGSGAMSRVAGTIGVDRAGAADSTSTGSMSGTSSTSNSAASTLDRTDREAAKRYVRTASWWTLVGLLAGIAASLVGSWVTAPDRIVVRPTADGAPRL